MRRDMIVGDDRHICFVMYLWVSGLVSWSRPRRSMAGLAGATRGLRKSFRLATRPGMVDGGRRASSQ